MTHVRLEAFCETDNYGSLKFFIWRKTMCQMSVVLEKDGKNELVLKAVARLDAGPDGVEVSTLFEAPKTVSGVRVKSIDFMAGVVTLAPLSDSGGRE